MIFFYCAIVLCLIALFLAVLRYVRLKKKDDQPDFGECIREYWYIPVLGGVCMLFAFMLTPHERILDKYYNKIGSQVDTVGTYVITFETYQQTTNKQHLVNLLGEGENHLQYKIRLFNTSDSTEILVSDCDKKSLITLTEGNDIFKRKKEDN